MIGWLANIITIVGLWNVGNKKRWAFLWLTCGETVWIYHSWEIGQPDLAFICVLFGILNFRSWWKWGDDKPQVWKFSKLQDPDNWDL